MKVRTCILMQWEWIRLEHTVGSSFAELRYKRECWKTSVSSALCIIWSLHSDMGKNAALSEAGGKRVIKDLKANQNPPPAALKRSPSNTRGFPLKRKAVCQTVLLGGDRSAAVRTLHRMQCEWFWLDKRISTVGYTYTSLHEREKTTLNMF